MILPNLNEADRVREWVRTRGTLGKPNMLTNTTSLRVKVTGEKVYSLQKYLRDGWGRGETWPQGTFSGLSDTLDVCPDEAAAVKPDAGFCRVLQPEYIIYTSSGVRKCWKIRNLGQKLGGIANKDLIQILHVNIQGWTSLKRRDSSKPLHKHQIKS